MTDTPGSHRDPIGFTAEQFGKAKSAAMAAGEKLVTDFEHLSSLNDQMREHGFDIAKIRFENPVTQAAWHAFTGHDKDLPMMPHEDDLAERARLRIAGHA